MKPKLRTLLVDIDGINTKNKYNLLKKDFQNRDPFFGAMIADTVFVDEDEIIAVRRTIEYEGEEFEYEFVEDYFIPVLDKMEQSYCKNIENSMECINGAEANIHFIDRNMDKIIEQIAEYEALNFLGEREKRLVNDKLQNVLDFLAAEKEPLVRTVDNKLNFNLQLNELVHFLKLLHENKIITGISITDLMRYAEKNFKYQKKDISRANKQLGSYIKSKNLKKFDEQALINFIKGKSNN